MNKHITTALSLLVLACAPSCSAGTNTADSNSVEAANHSAGDNATHDNAGADIPLGARAIIESYPQFFGQDAWQNGMLVWKDGTKTVYDDKRAKDHQERLDQADPEDMFHDVYDASLSPELPYLHDPGRSRNDAMFMKMYGNSAAAVQKNLTTVKWFGQNLRVHSANGMDKALRAVADELAKHPQLRKYLKSSGTFYWRQVRGAKRMSAHSYGIAIDIGVDHSAFWQWKNPRATETSRIKYSNSFPMELVKIFEKHGFIWGGAWYHYDTMHFEYRPEIIRYAQLFKDANKNKGTEKQAAKK